MAVREKTVTRCTVRVKTYPTSCGWFAITTRARRNPGCVAVCLLASRRSFLQVLVVPGEDAIQAVQEMFFFVEAVRLAGVQDEFSLDSIAFEAAVELLALTGGSTELGAPWKNRGGGFRILRWKNGRVVRNSAVFFGLVG